MSRSQARHRLYLVPSASHAIKGETALVEAGITCALIPVPRTISSQCGVCLRVRLSAHEQAERTLANAGVSISGIHDFEDEAPSKEAADER